METNTLTRPAHNRTTKDSRPAPAENLRSPEETKVQAPAPEGFVAAAVALERARQTALRIDGLIIGTGQEDFTKGNTLYTLHHTDKIFQLMDVPGIEGDESHYVHLVKDAVAKAHLVFYVQGTNKKPEATTVQKIRAYLKRGTQVCPLVNVRGFADAYESDEDRQDLTQHGGASDALKQTHGTLAAALRPDMLIPGHCVQGLLAFSALAYTGQSNTTSIHPSRNEDLGRAQRGYLKVFGSPSEMRHFSGIESVADVLRGKLGSFRADIIEANKTKVRELLSDTLKRLERTRQQHDLFMVKVQSDFDHCRDSLSEAFKTFESTVRTTRRQLTTQFFTDLSGEADDIVERHFGDNDTIDQQLSSAFKSGQQQLEQKFQESISECANELVGGSQTAVERLLQDIGRKNFEWSRKHGSTTLNNSYKTIKIDMGLGLKGWGSMAARVASYAATGAVLGFGIPGAIVGAVLGVLMGFLDLFTSKEKRIRKAQQQVQGAISSARRDALEKAAHADDALIADARTRVHDALLNHIEQLRADLNSPRHLIQQQTNWLQHLLQRLKDMPHGTIQAV